MMGRGQVSDGDRPGGITAALPAISQPLIYGGASLVRKRRLTLALVYVKDILVINTLLKD